MSNTFVHADDGDDGGPAADDGTGDGDADGSEDPPEPPPPPPPPDCSTNVLSLAPNIDASHTYNVLDKNESELEIKLGQIEMTITECEELQTIKTKLEVRDLKDREKWLSIDQMS